MSFVLTETAELAIMTPAGQPAISRWQFPPHLNKSRPCLILRAGERWEVPFTGDRNVELFVSLGCGLPEIPPEGCALYLKALTADGPVHLLTVPITNPEQHELLDVRVSLGHLPQNIKSLEVSVSASAPASPLKTPSPGWLGRLRQFRNHRDNPDPGTGEGESSNCVSALAISELVIGHRDQIPLLRARAFHELRLSNELAHFASAYDHEIYDARQRKMAPAAVLRPAASGRPPSQSPRPDISSIMPGEVDDVYHFAHRLLSAGLLIKPPNFHQRLADLAASRTLSIISCCAGTAQVEAAIIRATDQPVSLTLVDFSQPLLDQAAAAMPENCEVTTIVQDINAIALPPESFDIAIFVSGAHHVVELEYLWRELHHALRPGGELWLIGEQIGPNGNRLDADCLDEVNRIFCSLPDRLRHNAHTGEVDTEISDRDYAEATFEGIRSDDIETTLARHFVPVDIYKRNCFLWRLVNQTYFNNYNLAATEDVETIRSMVAAEIDYFLSGGRATELHGVYRAIS